MKKNNLKRFLASLLAVLMLASATGMSPAVFADWGDSARAGIGTLAAKSGEKIVLNGERFEIKIPYKDGSIDTDALKKLVFETCVNVSDSNPSDLTYDNKNLSIEKKGSDDLIFHSLSSITDGETCKVRFQYKVSAIKYVNATCDITFIGRDEAPFKFNSEITELGIVYVKDSSINYEATAQRIREALVTATGDISIDNIAVEYNNFTDTTPNFVSLDDKTNLFKPFGLGQFTIRLSWTGNNEYKAYNQTKSINFVDNRIQSTIVFKENATITYNMDAAAQKEAIIKNAIDYEQSKLPAETGVNDFTVKINGKEIPDAKLDAGENQTIYISYNGNVDYKPSEDAECTINVEKANVKVSVTPISKIYAGQDIDRDTFYTLNPNDPELDVYIFFVGFNVNKETCVSLKLSEKQEKLIDAISDVQQKFFDTFKIDGVTLKAKLQKGMTLSELRQVINDVVNNDFMMGLLKLAGYDVETIKSIITAIDKLTDISVINDNTIISIGIPAHAGIYSATAIAVGKNYETGTGTGTLIILKNWKNVKLEKTDVIDNGKITVSDAEAIRNGEKQLCMLTQNGEPLNSSSAGAIHYWFTGVGKLYAKSEMPTAPGKYIVTVSVRGGDFYALPKTFTFTIVPDPAPEVTPEA